MKTAQQVLLDESAPITLSAKPHGAGQLVLIFGPTARLHSPGFLAAIRAAFPPETLLVGCSTSGEITRDGALDGAVTLTSLEFAKATLRVECAPVPEMAGSRAAGGALGAALRGPELKCVMVFSDGLHVNGSDVVKGLRAELGDGIVISGGLAGDGTAFARTVVLAGAEARENSIVAVGFYGAGLLARSFSASGWQPFGNLLQVTRSSGSVVHEFDGRRALDVYCKYLGDKAGQLPAAGLLHPVALQVSDKGGGLIRTLLAVDRDQGTLTFAGDVPEGGSVRLMQATFAQLIEGAGRAGCQTSEANAPAPEFGLLISCVGRKLVLGSQTELEIEAVAEQLPTCPHLTGFYSYGEIGFYEGSGSCELHNQTMTVTTLAECP